MTALEGEPSAHLTLGVGPQRPIQGDVRIDASSRMEVVSAIEGAAESVGAAWGLDPEACRDLGLAVREAVINALRHGSPTMGRVVVRFRFRNRNVVATIRDQGPGFDPASVPDPLKSENVAKGSGRGILYMRRFVDKVSFSFPRIGGTVVRLEKALT